MKSILVIGLGRFGKHLALKMQELGNDVMVVDREEEIIEQYAPLFTDAHIGDCCQESVLRSLGINNFDICFVTIGEDFQSSLEVTSLLNELGAEFIVSRAKEDRQAKLLKKIGAHEVIYPEKEIAEKLAIRCNAKNIFDYIQLTPEYSIYEIPIIEQWVGKSIESVNVRSKYGVNIIAVKNEKRVNPLPGAEYKFMPHDHIVVIGKSTEVFSLASKT